MTVKLQHAAEIRIAIERQVTALARRLGISREEARALLVVELKREPDKP